MHRDSRRPSATTNRSQKAIMALRTVVLLSVLDTARALQDSFHSPASYRSKPLDRFVRELNTEERQNDMQHNEERNDLSINPIQRARWTQEDTPFNAEDYIVDLPPPNIELFPFQYNTHSSPTGDDFAGGMSYDSQTHSLLVTGNVRVGDPFGESDCFLTKLSLGDLNSEIPKPLVELETTYGTPSSESCTSVSSVGPASINQAVLLGYSQRDGLMTHLYQPGTLPSAVFGFAALVPSQPDPTSESTSSNIAQERMGDLGSELSGLLFHDVYVQYPSTVARFTNGDILLSMLMSSSDDVVPLSGNIKDYDINNFPVYGKEFKIYVARISYRGSDGELKTEWERIMGTQDSQSAYVRDVKIVTNKHGDEIVIMAGDTAGHGSAFGAGVKSLDANDVDGFITKLDGLTGELVGNFENESYHAATHSFRIASLPGAIDKVGGICASVNSRDPNGAIYVVGTTEGLMDPTFDFDMGVNSRKTTSFVQKIELDTLNVVWTRQLGGDKIVENTQEREVTDVVGMGCAVTSNGEGLYVAGTVADGGAINEQSSKGDVDIFVSHYQTTSGTLDFVRQTGTSRREWLAKQNPILTDKDGHAIVLGTTDGKFATNDKGEEPPEGIQESTSGADLFILQLYNPLAKPEGENNETPRDIPEAGDGIPDTLDTSQRDSSSASSSSGSNSNGLSFVAKTGISVLCALGVIGVFLVAYFVRVRQLERRRLEELRAADPDIITSRHPNAPGGPASVGNIHVQHHHHHHQAMSTNPGHDIDDYSFDMASIHEEGLRTTIMSPEVAAAVAANANGNSNSNNFAIEDEHNMAALSSPARSNYNDLINSYSNYIIEDDEDLEDVNVENNNGVNDEMDVTTASAHSAGVVGDAITQDGTPMRVGKQEIRRSIV